MLKITRQVTLLLLAGALSFPAYSYATQATEVTCLVIFNITILFWVNNKGFVWFFYILPFLLIILSYFFKNGLVLAEL